MKELKEFLKKRRNLEKSTLVEDAIERDGYFDAAVSSGGNFDDAFQLGQECGEAELIEVLFYILNKKTKK